MPAVALHNLGCSKNQIDGERILRFFREAGYAISTDFSTADVIVVNTCAFIREAQEEAIEAILVLAVHKKNGRCRTLIVSGCFSERYRDEVRKKFPEVDLWIGVHDWEPLLRTALRVASVSAGFWRELQPPFHVQYLKIAEGCSHGCTYCVIPYIRGPFRSRPVAEITEEARWLEARGTRELILVAQDSSFYGRDAKTSLPRLLEALLKTTTIPWIRIMYLHPAYVGEDLLRLIATEQRLCPYFDMPLQHIADPILKAMNRRPGAGAIRKLIRRIRETVPHVGLRTTFIAGFPGETTAHFRELLSFIEEIQFDKLGVFPYSPEQGTRAFTMKPRPRDTTVARRCEEIMALQRDISARKLAAKIGATIEVIVDGPSDRPDFAMIARTRIDAPEVDGKVYLRNDMKPGTIADVTVSGASDHDLFA